MTEHANGAHLTTSRINRLLRPLRNKCNGLATLSKSAIASSRVTYYRQSNWDVDCRPPLIVLCPPAGTKKLTPDKRSADEFELSRRIYAVCDAFKNIAYVAYGQLRTERVPSLAAMCTLVVGRNMPTEDSDAADSSEDSTDENDQLDVDSIYETVPPHYRRFLVVSHALSMILGICTHHHTLVTILLDHCLSFGLIHESTRLLNMVLAQAFLPPHPLHPPPITHPAHTNYLVDLHAKWVAGNKSSGTTLQFTTSTFCQAVLGALSQSSSCSSHLLWTSKVMNRLFNTVESCDIDSYISIIYTLSSSFCATAGSSSDAIRVDTPPVVLRNKFSELLSTLFDLLFRDSHSPPPTSRICAVVDMLCDCHAAQLHSLRVSTPGSPIDLPDVIILFTTHIFVAFRNSVDNSDHLLAILDDCGPVPTTFSKLMAYFSRPQGSQSFDDIMDAFFTELKVYSSALRIERLFGLDASLWACALHHFETTLASSQKGNPTLMARYKRQLMEGVDAAERRCFAEDVYSSPVVSFPVRSNRSKSKQRGRLSGHWEWEDMVGSWIRMTPVHKKRKIEDSREHIPDSHSRGSVSSKAVPGSTSISTVFSSCHRRLSTSSFSPSPQLSETDGSEYQAETDKENCFSSSPVVVKRSRPAKRRSSNFFSLLADAQANRIVLHPKSPPEPKPPSLAIPKKYALPLSSHGFRRAVRKQEKKPVQSRTLLLSDDSLDLFAYATSSPASMCLELA